MVEFRLRAPYAQSRARRALLFQRQCCGGKSSCCRWTRHRSQGLKGSTWVLRSSGAAFGEIINWIIARAASGSFDFVDRPTLDVHGLFRKPGNGPTYSVPGTPTMMLVC